MLIRVKVIAGAKKESVREIENGLDISVREKAMRNEANKRVFELVREHYPDAEHVRLISGQHQSAKIFEIST